MKTGVAADPKFTWVDTLGYRQTGASWSEVYVRARHYSLSTGRWTAVDRLWPDQLAYAYVRARPTDESDPSGDQWWKVVLVVATLGTICIVWNLNQCGKCFAELNNLRDRCISCCQDTDCIDANGFSYNGDKCKFQCFAKWKETKTPADCTEKCLNAYSA